MICDQDDRFSFGNVIFASYSDSLKIEMKGDFDQKPKYGVKEVFHVRNFQIEAKIIPDIRCQIPHQAAIIAIPPSPSK